MLSLFLLSCKESEKSIDYDADSLMGGWHVLKYSSLEDTVHYFEIYGEDKVVFNRDSTVELTFRNKVDTSLKITYSIINKGELKLSLYKNNVIDSTFTQNYYFKNSNLIFSDIGSLTSNKIELMREKDFKLMKRDIGCKLCLLEIEGLENDCRLVNYLVENKKGKDKYSDSLYKLLKKNGSDYYIKRDSLMKQFNHLDYGDLLKEGVVLEKAERMCLEKYPFNMKDTIYRKELLGQYYAYSMLWKINYGYNRVQDFVDKKRFLIIAEISNGENLSEEAELMLFNHARNYVAESGGLNRVKLGLMNDSLLMKCNPSFKSWPDSLCLPSREWEKIK